MFTRDPSDPDSLAVWHRRDVRAVMLRDLDLAIPPEIARSINAAAVAWYMSFDDAFARTEELYHRLRLDQAPGEIEPRWMEEAEDRLKYAIEDFPPRAAKYVRSRPQSAARSEIGYAAGAKGWTEPDAEELRHVVQREIQRGEAPLATLIRYNANSLDSEVDDAYANALVLAGRLDKLLLEVLELRSRPRAGLRVRAAVFAVAAGVLEGHDKLDEALIYWTEAQGSGRRGRGLEAYLTWFSARVGSLRVRRKLQKSQGRRAQSIRELTDDAARLSSEIARRPILLREAVAELGGEFTENDPPTFTRWLEVLLDGVEAFPSALVEQGRLRTIADRLGAPGDISASRLGPFALKLIWERRAPVIIEPCVRRSTGALSEPYHVPWFQTAAGNSAPPADGRHER